MKKILSILLVALMVVALVAVVGCQGPPKHDEPEPSKGQMALKP